MRENKWFWLGIGMILAGVNPCCQRMQPAPTSAQEPEAVERAGPPSPVRKDSPATTAGDQRWPLVREGSYIRLMDRVWNTRKPALLREEGGVGTLGQRNGTATYLGEDRVARGTVFSVVEIPFAGPSCGPADAPARDVTLCVTFRHESGEPAYAIHG